MNCRGRHELALMSRSPDNGAVVARQANEYPRPVSRMGRFGRKYVWQGSAARLYNYQLCRLKILGKLEYRDA